MFERLPNRIFDYCTPLFSGEEVRNWLRIQGLEADLNFSSEGYLYLWSVFQEKAYRLLSKANKNKFQDGVILWTSELTKPHHISR